MDKFAALDLLLTKAAILKIAEETGLPPDQVVDAVASSPEAEEAVEEEKKAMLVDMVEEAAFEKIAMNKWEQHEYDKAYNALRKKGLTHQEASAHLEPMAASLRKKTVAARKVYEGATRNVKGSFKAENMSPAILNRLKKGLAAEKTLKQWPHRAVSWAGKHPVAAGAGGAALLAGLGGAGYGAYRYGQEHPQSKAAAWKLAELL